MSDLIQLIVNNGIGIVCVAYLIYFNLTTMKDINQTLSNVNTNLTLLSEKISNLEDSINKEGN